MRFILNLWLVYVSLFHGVHEVIASVQDSSRLLGAYSSILFGITMALWFFSPQGAWRCILNGVRITALLLVTTGPLFFASGDAKYAAAVTLSGILGLAVVTIGFRKDLYPTK